jgi:hypothetical protein
MPICPITAAHSRVPACHDNTPPISYVAQSADQRGTGVVDVEEPTLNLKYEDFTAIHDHMSKTLRVDGNVIVEHGGFAVRLQPFEGNPGINPRMLTLELVATPTGESPSHQTVHHDQPWEDGTDYNQVSFRVKPPIAEAPPTLDIEDVY